MTKTNVCKFCGKACIRKYCNRNCYFSGRWKVDGKCKTCGQKTEYRFCSNKCNRSYWDKNDYHLRKKRQFWEKKLKLIKELGGKCRKCGIADIQVLEINHINKDKKERPKKLQYTWQRRIKEWNKNKNNLELLCANCHRKLTWKQMNWGKY